LYTAAVHRATVLSQRRSCCGFFFFFFFVFFFVFVFVFVVLFCRRGLLPFPQGATPGDQVYRERYWLSEAEDMEGGTIRYDVGGRKRNESNRNEHSKAETSKASARSRRGRRLYQKSPNKMIAKVDGAKTQQMRRI
jgi:hypothetical protein